MADHDSRIDGFFESYRRAFERLDAPAIADHYAYPLHIAGDMGSEVDLTTIAHRKDWIEQIERLLDMYRAIDFSSARILGSKTTQLSSLLAQTAVRWGLYDGGNHLLYDFEAVYTLVTVSGNLRIAAISHNEMLRSRESIARRRAEH